MHKRIFYSILGIASLSLLLFFSVVILTISKSIEHTWTQNLASETHYIERIVSQEGLTALDHLAGPDKRITLVAPDGQVLYDSVKESSTLENHLNRQEIQEALHKGEGMSIRYSDTIWEMSIYYAQVLPDGNILRLALLQQSILAYYKALIPALLGILFLLLILSYLGAKHISASILAPILKIDLHNPQLIHSPYKELTPILNILVEQAKTIQETNQHKEAYRREFTSNISHELKTPLTSISGFAELMKEGDLSTEDVVDFSSTIHQESQRLIQLVNDIIKLSELDGSLQHLDKEWVNLYELMEDIVGKLGFVAQKRGIQILLTGKPLLVYGNAKILHEIFYNLCDNAIKYNRDQGRVHISLMDEAHRSVIKIEDTGLGIQKEDIPHIFERFYRADKSHSKRIEGTGLGLSIVKHGLFYHGAAIEVDSQVGSGTCMSIYFPHTSQS